MILDSLWKSYIAKIYSKHVENKSGTFVIYYKSNY